MDSNRHPVTPSLVADIETYLKRFMSFPDPSVTLPLALWTIATHCFMTFDSFPYMCITASTKQAGKTRLAELLSFACSEPFFTTGATAAAVFTAVDVDTEQGEVPPTIFFDEAEELSKGDAGTMRSVLNSGYRMGQSIARVGRSYKTYCPKVFVLIGDVYDTLRDRSIIVTLRRGSPAERFTYKAVSELGAALRDSILELVSERRDDIANVFKTCTGLPFLGDRDEEIWTPLFCVAAICCPDRFDELSRIAVDMCTAKTHEAKEHVEVAGCEDKALLEEYRVRLLQDVYNVMTAANARVMSSAALLEALKAIPTSPWRMFRNENGLTAINMSDMLQTYDVRPKTRRVSLKSHRADSKGTIKGYKYEEVVRAIEANTSPRHPVG